MFVDIRNFTKLSENLPPKEVTEILNTWYTQIEEIANEYRGTVDKFLGDGALIMFGAPLESTQHADMALRAGRKMIAASESLAVKWKEERNIDFSIGVAVNSGFAFVGFVGPKNKLEYTAIGDTVNTAARLQDQTKVFHTSLIFSENTLKQCQNVHLGSELNSLGSIKVRGKNQSIPIYTFEDMFTNGYTQASVLAEQSANQANEVLDQAARLIREETSVATALALSPLLEVQAEEHPAFEKQAPAQIASKTSLALGKANPFSGKLNVSKASVLKPIKPLPPTDES
jgi:class 3 adenylate cyclase